MDTLFFIDVFERSHPFCNFDEPQNMRIAICLILVAINYAGTAQDIKIQYAAKYVRNGKSDAGYTYDYRYNLVATRDSVFVSSENLEFGFSHSYTPEKVEYYFLGYSDDFKERKWKKTELKPEAVQIRKTGKTKNLLNFLCEEYSINASTGRAIVYVTRQLPFKTLAYYPLFFGMDQKQPAKFNFLLGNIDGAVLELRMGDSLNYTSVQAISLHEGVAKENLNWFNKPFVADKLPKDFLKAFRSIKNKPLDKNDLAPTFSLPLVNGEIFNTAEWDGYVKVYDFWGIWCPGCVAEIPALNQIKHELKDEKVKFIAFTNDYTAFSANYKAKRPFNFEVASNADWIMRKFGVGILPVTYIIGKDNGILYRMDDPLIERSLGKEKYDQAIADFVQKVKEALDASNSK